MQGEKLQKVQVFSIMSVSIVQLNSNLHLNKFLEALHGSSRPPPHSPYLFHIFSLDFMHFGKLHINEDAF